MPIRVRTGTNLGYIGTTKLLSISSSGTLYSLGSGMVAFEATNIGSQTISYGDSATLNNGGLITSNSSKFWDSIVGDFIMYFVVNSGGVSSNLVVQEYNGL